MPPRRTTTGVRKASEALNSRPRQVTKASSAATAGARRPSKAAAKRSGADDDDDDDDDDDNGDDDDDDNDTDSGKGRDNGTTAAKIPTKLLTKLLHDNFKDDRTRITKDANAAVAEYMKTFVREAIARAKLDREGSSGSKGKAADGFLEVEDLEKLVPQLLLDF